MEQASQPTGQREKRVVIVSGFQDYRSRKRASIQQVADGLVSLNYDVSFISTRFSELSKRTGDSRLFLQPWANKIQIVNGVRCFLWKTVVHPFSSRNPVINGLMGSAFSLYMNWPNRTFDSLVGEADYVVVESGVAAIYLDRIRRLNSSAKIIYYAADRLDTIGAHPFVLEQLAKNSRTIDHVCLRSSAMKDAFSWAAGRLYKAEFGINEADYDEASSSPYRKGLHAISVGSMLFDRNFFQVVAPEFPNVTFHVIGCGERFEAPENVVIYREMKFKDTLPYLKHATFGVAPYRTAVGVEYLAESSLKLAQYDFLSLPAVCPNFAVGEQQSRFGYSPEDASSMISATCAALGAAGRTASRKFPTWAEVGERMLHPEDYPSSRI